MNSLSEKILKILQENEDEEFSSDSDLPNECYFCAATYFINPEYVDHLKSHNENKNDKRIEKTHQCPHDGCDKAFLRISDLKKHQVGHNLHCDFCNNLFLENPFQHSKFFL